MIVDFHTHHFPDKIAAQTVAALEKSGNTTAFSDGTQDGLLRSMIKAGVDLSVNLPVLTKPGQFESILRFAVSLNEKFAAVDIGEPKILSFAGMHPDVEEPEQKLREVKESGILGIKIHPDYQSTYIDDERYVRILSEAKKLGLITVTHAGFDAAYPGQPIKCTPTRILRLLDRIGGYDRLVLAHMGGNQLFSEVYDLLAGEAVYFDTAYVLRSFSDIEFKRMLQKHGDEKILFATDSPWSDVAQDVDAIKSFGLGALSEKRVFSENAIKLLGI